MSGTLSIRWPRLESMLQDMVDVGLQATEIDDYFQAHVVNVAGLDYETCALKPIGDLLPYLGSAFGHTRTYYQKRWADVIRAIAQSAADVANVDNEIQVQMGKYSGALDAMPDVAITVSWFGPKELEGLETPEEGEPKLKHNSTWTKTSEGYDATRDGINEAIDFINGFGFVTLPRLSDDSLEDYIVYPLAGNYKLLGANANACTNVNTAFLQWAANFGRLSVQARDVATGQTAEELVDHLGLYVAVMISIGEAIGAGKSVFDSIAAMSEKIAVAVENALVKMATKLTKLLAKLSSKLSWIGWAAFFVELAEKKWAAVTDIYDDIKECMGIIEACLGLVEEIEAWAQAMKDSLKAMEAIRDMVEELPKVDGDLSTLPPVHLEKFEKTLGEISVEVEVNPEEEESLEDRLDDLDGETDDDGDGEALPEPEDGEMIMAPGPLQPPYGPGTPPPVVA